MSYFQHFTSILLLTTLILATQNAFGEITSILHCHSYYDALFHNFCAKCLEGFILNQAQSDCLPLYDSPTNCIQVSDANECMRCECGYSLQQDNGTCLISSNSLIGCEIFVGDSICIRPKSNYLLLKSSHNITNAVVLFAGGSHCEVFDLENVVCILCHSGFQLDKESKCNRVARRIVNEFFSYFSQDGDLQSRQIGFVAFKDYGVFPKIANCIVYEGDGPNEGSSSQQTSPFSLKCKECSLGRALNQRHTSCLTSPFDICKIVSDSDHSLCEECIDNDHFYLSSISNFQSQPQQQICLPRQKYIDPTIRCLEYAQDSHLCTHCSPGLVSTSSGCELQQQPSSKKSQIIRFSTSQKGFYFFERLSNDPNCALWDQSGTICLSCKQLMLLNNKGQCQYNFNILCLIPRDQGGCYKCRSLRYFNEAHQYCIDITQNSMCAFSNGLSDKCDRCLSNYQLIIGVNICEPYKTIRRCAWFSEYDQSCQQCSNLYYFSDPITCREITHKKNCFVSDGYENYCLQCQNNYVLSESEGCIPQIAILGNNQEEQYCVDPAYFFDKTTKICTAFSFQNVGSCYRFNSNENICLECKQGFFIHQNGCAEIKDCQFSDGINNWCYQASLVNDYIDDLREVKAAAEGTCQTNRIEKICKSCSLEENKEQSGFWVVQQNEETNQDQESCIDPSSIQAEYTRTFDKCFRLRFNPIIRSYSCDLCQSFYYPSEDGTCKPILDINCLVSNGRSQICSLCKKHYELNSEISTSCEKVKNNEIKIQFCEIMKESSCVKCQNLYFTVSHQCLPIFDPDCVESEGIYNRCLKCASGNIINLFLYGNMISQMSCHEYDHIISEYSNIDGKTGSLREEYNQFKSKKRITKVECKIFSTDTFQCLECNEGFYFKEIFSNTRVCIQIAIPNCISINQEQFACSKCAQGYFLTQNNICINLEYCLEFNIVCVKCTDDSLLVDGICIRLDNCEDQYKDTCYQCDPGYALAMEKNEMRGSKSSRDLHNQLEQTNRTDRNSLEEQQIGKAQQDLRKTGTTLNPCQKIPGCSFSNGINEFCLECDKSLDFKLVNSICVKNSLFLEELATKSDGNSLNNTSSSSSSSFVCLVKDIISKECLQCKNLFYLQNHQCFPFSNLNNPHCQSNDGISSNCKVCSFKGYAVDKVGNCQKIDLCIISNGINYCILCVESHFVNSQGKCEEILYPQKNCDVYSSGQSQRQEEDTVSLAASDNSSANNINCSKCSNLYYITLFNQNKCQKLPDSDQILCAFSNGMEQNCSVCYPGYVLKKRSKGIGIQCQQAKRIVKILNPGCEIFSSGNECLKCYEQQYYLFKDKNGSFCQIRNLEEKCNQFDPKEDKCLICRNGYKLLKIKEHFQEKVICMRLETSEIVENCQEYFPNTNKCIKCLKKLKQDVLEYFLDEKENKCDDILYLMCKTVVRSSSGYKCYEDYIENCKTYESKEDGLTGGCIECKNGYYHFNQGSQKEETICLKHLPIENCRIYSQDVQNGCDECQPEFFLKQPDLCIYLDDESNCKVIGIDQKRCTFCQDKFALDSKTGICIVSQILHCKILRTQEQSSMNQLCLACQDNYYVSDDQKECIFKLTDQNCKSFNQKTKCIECQQGFLLTLQGDCVQTNGNCRISNCAKFDEISSSENILCTECDQKYFLNEFLQCSALDQETDNERNPQKEEEEETQNVTHQSDSIFETIPIWILVIAVLVASVIRIGLKALRIKLKNKRLQDEITNYEDNKYVMETNISIQMGQPIQMNSNHESSLTFENQIYSSS